MCRSEIPVSGDSQEAWELPSPVSTRTEAAEPEVELASAQVVNAQKQMKIDELTRQLALLERVGGGEEGQGDQTAELRQANLQVDMMKMALNTIRFDAYRERGTPAYNYHLTLVERGIDEDDYERIADDDPRRDILNTLNPAVAQSVLPLLDPLPAPEVQVVEFNFHRMRFDRLVQDVDWQELLWSYLPGGADDPSPPEGFAVRKKNTTEELGYILECGGTNVPKMLLLPGLLFLEVCLSNVKT
eukprot:SAG22_NODE_1271_length_4929_cov_4.159420_1_plen_244_part_00